MSSVPSARLGRGDAGTPAQRKVRAEVRDALAVDAAPHTLIFGASPRQHITRGERPCMPVPRHLQSSVGDLIFGGPGVTVTEPVTSSAAEGELLQAAPASPPKTPLRGLGSSVGGARIHEIGHRQNEIGVPTRDPTQAHLVHQTFGAPTPTRPTVGSREHLSRAYRHMNSTADAVMWNRPEVPHAAPW